jgi:hypothetical protein
LIPYRAKGLLVLFLAEQSTPVLFAHIFTNSGNKIPILILSMPILLVVNSSHSQHPYFSDFQTGGKWLSKVLVDPFYLR